MNIEDDQDNIEWPECYTLEEAARALEKFAGERFDTVLESLSRAVAERILPVYERGRNARYFSPTVRDWYEQAHWDDLNRWLSECEPRIEWHFPSPSIRVDTIFFGPPGDTAKLDEEVEYYSAFRETVYNGTAINWNYWVGQIPKLSHLEAARLMAGLDPDIFENLDNRPNKNDPSSLCKHAKHIERLAEREGQGLSTPREWLDWATARSLVVHDAFRLAVRQDEPETVDKPLSVASQSAKRRISAGQRNDVLDSVIQLAKDNSLDHEDSHSVFTELKKLAKSKTGPLVEVVDGEGIKYLDSLGNYEIFTRKALSDRMRRARAR